MAYMTYKEKEQLVRSGKSKIFNNWHEFAGVSMDDFLEGLLWLEEDPGDDQGRLTRELGCKGDSKLFKLEHVYVDAYRAEPCYYEVDSRKQWYIGNGAASINKYDKL